MDLAAIAATAAVVAAVAAIWSAVVASSALRQVKKSEARQCHAEVAQQVQQIAGEYERALELSKRVENEFTSYLVLTGNVKSSAHDHRKEALARLREELEAHRAEAQKYDDQREALSKLPKGELATLSYQLRSDLSKLQVKSHNLRDELEDLRMKTSEQRTRNATRHC